MLYQFLLAPRDINTEAKLGTDPVGGQPILSLYFRIEKSGVSGSDINQRPTNKRSAILGRQSLVRTPTYFRPIKYIHLSQPFGWLHHANQQQGYATGEVTDNHHLQQPNRSQFKPLRGPPYLKAVCYRLMAKPTPGQQG